MEYAHPEALVETGWLETNLEKPGVRIVDATYAIPGVTIDAKAEFEAAHIPGAVFFDINAVADPDSDFAHMLPDAEKFSGMVGALGIARGDHVVAYDKLGGFGAAARAWWMFRAFGHGDVSWLNGSLPKWLDEGRPVTGDANPPRPKEYGPAALNAGLVRNFEQMRANVESRAEQVIDARSRGRFTAEEPETNPANRGGHIPGSVSLPYKELLNPDDGTILGADQLAAKFADAGVDLKQPIANTCGSGVTACIPLLGLYLLGVENASVYDGSWAEWGRPGDAPVETGP